ncbi:MAG: hypothetical protein ACD_12C00866G0002 [uncultured bacterium]|nr:MAG: hypothetical protein ACD_12C00866G0002 [uncultured bacterium]HBR79707.1 hypothetical protein [Candidatus Moranbacteria bacterium]
MLELEDYSDHAITGGNGGDIFHNGACVNEVAETIRKNGGDLITCWYCIAFGGICTFNVKTENCKNKKFTPFKRKLGPRPIYGVKYAKRLRPQQ